MLGFDWPEHFPEGCPPENASPAAGTVLRLVKANPPTEADFLTHAERMPDKNFGDRRCVACGVSVHTAEDDIMRLRRRVAGFKNRLIAEGALTAEDGLLKSTPSKTAGQSHRTWWVPLGGQRVNNFFVVDPVEDASEADD